MAVRNTVCAFSGQWSFEKALPPRPSNFEILTAQYNNGQYLGVDGSGNVIMQAAPYSWAFEGTNSLQTQYAAFATSVPINYEQPSTLSYLDCGADNLVLKTSAPGADNPFMLNKDVVWFSTDSGGNNSLYAPSCQQYYIPSDDGTKLVPSTDLSKIYLWKFTGVPQPGPSEASQPSGTYMVSLLLPSSQKTLYLNYSPDKNIAYFATAPLDLNTGAFIWKNEAPQNFTTACGTYAASKTANDDLTFMSGSTMGYTFVMRQNSITISQSAQAPVYLMYPYQRADNSIVLFQLPSVWSLYQNISITTQVVISPTPPTSIDSGTYHLKYGNQCLGPDGKLSTTACEFWRYSKDDNTLTNRAGQCLINPGPTTLCGNISDLTVGLCSDPNAKRFLLGTDKLLHDPANQLCYDYSGSTSLRLGSGSGPSTSNIMIPLIVAGLIIVVALLWARKRGGGGSITVSQ